MARTRFITLAVLLVSTLAKSADYAGASSLEPSALRCEYLINPLGIDSNQPRLTWLPTPVDPKSRGLRQTAYQVLVADQLNNLSADRGILWNSGKVVSSDTANVEYGGRPLRSGEHVVWKVRIWDQNDRPSRWSEPASWSMGLLNRSDWHAQWIGDPQRGARADEWPESVVIGKTHRPDAPPTTMVRQEFVVASPVRRATAYVTARGLYELRLNGRRVGKQVLAPEWTDYFKRVQYQVYDVTGQVRQGNNAIGAILGDGWYAGLLPGTTRYRYGRAIQLLLRLEIETEDGEIQAIVSDDSWRSTIEGPIRSSCIYFGEDYDARREMPGWDEPGFDDRDWQPVFVDAALGDARLVHQPNEPLRQMRKLHAVAMTEPRPGVFIYDLGQNITGWCRITVRGKAGTTVKLRFAEALRPDGDLDTTSLRAVAPLCDTYTLHGKGEEVYEPRFTFHGFRFVEVTGLPCALPCDAVVGCVIYSSGRDVGTFTCSSPMVTKLMENARWSLYGNLIGIPLDCPQRFERLGWLGDAQSFSPTMIYTLDMAGFFTKWLADIRDEQNAQGMYPDFAPVRPGEGPSYWGAPAWSDGGVIVPWQAWLHYADTHMIESHYDSMCRFVDGMVERDPNLLRLSGRGKNWGDWMCPPGGAMPKASFGSAFFAHSVDLLGRMAEGIGREEDARKYRDLFRRTQAAFVAAYVKPDGAVNGNRQSSYALALHFNLLPDELRPKAVDRLLDCIQRANDHVTTGIHTSNRLMLALTRAGHTDVAYRLLNQTTAPSWGRMIDQDATTIWESWYTYDKTKGIKAGGGNSLNHYGLGSVGEWMWRTIVGINPDPARPGYHHVIIRPEPGGGLTWAKGRYESIRGPIQSEWAIHRGTLQMKVVVPPNMTATIHVPRADNAAVSEGGKPAAQSSGVRLQVERPDIAVYDVGSGEYQFSVKAPTNL